MINKKKNIYKLLVSLSLLTSIILTLIGSISIVYFIMFMYEMFNISLFCCFVLDILLPNIYSVCCKFITNKFDKKIDDVKVEINKLEKEYSIGKKISDILNRIDGLSRNRQIEILKYIKNDLSNSNMFDNVDLLDAKNVRLINESLDKEIKKRTLNIYDSYSCKY